METMSNRELSRRAFLQRSAGVALIAGGLPAILAACTGAANNNPPASSGGGASKPLRVGWSSEPDTMNALTTYSTEAQEVLQLIYDKLSDYDANLNVIPGLAASTAVSADGMTVTYNLRPGVTWHDGQPFTADDVVSTFTLIHRPGGASQYAQWLTDMTAVTAKDPTTVEVTYREASGVRSSPCHPDPAQAHLGRDE